MRKVKVENNIYGMPQGARLHQKAKRKKEKLSANKCEDTGKTVWMK